MSDEIVKAGFNPVSLMPVSFREKQEMATVLFKSGLIPSGLNTPEKVCVALEWGHELQLSPMVAVNNIAVINGKPTLSADLMGALVKRSPEYGGIEWIEQTDKKAECIITRILSNGKEEKYTSTFTIEDAEKAGLLGKDVWKKYPKRMLKHRCMAYGLRDLFPDLLAGLYEPEEMESVDVPKEKNITEEATVVTYDEPVPEPSAAEIESELQHNDDSVKLSNIVEKYEKALDVNNQNGNPYQKACEVLAAGNPDAIAKMLVRVTKYLGLKGIQVA